ncbi:hypothetical protein BY996DRAFT_6443190 [Phakopsora pachyrhizi]|nr:hypothetical protein BY996DRAFT_6443190 [Phakopsora pachyrhizi]
MKERGKALGWMEWQRFWCKGVETYYLVQFQQRFLINGSAEDVTGYYGQHRSYQDGHEYSKEERVDGLIDWCDGCCWRKFGGDWSHPRLLTGQAKIWDHP